MVLFLVPGSVWRVGATQGAGLCKHGNCLSIGSGLFKCLLLRLKLALEGLKLTDQFVYFELQLFVVLLQDRVLLEESFTVFTRDTVSSHRQQFNAIGLSLVQTLQLTVLQDVRFITFSASQVALGNETVEFGNGLPYKVHGVVEAFAYRVDAVCWVEQLMYLVKSLLGLELGPI